jgi:hypothetical protein
VKYCIYKLEKKVVLGMYEKISYLTKARKETQPSLKRNRLIDSVLELARYARFGDEGLP